MIIGDQTGIGKGRQAAAMVRYGMLAGYFPIFLTDRYTLFSDMYRDCKALGIKDARPLILNQKVSVVDFDKIIEDDPEPDDDEIWSPNQDDEDDGEAEAVEYQQRYEEVYKSPKKKELELTYRAGDIPDGRFEYMMLTYSQLKDAKKDMTRLDFLTSVCEKHRVLFIFDEAHKSSSVTGNISVITQSINSILVVNEQTQGVFLSATFAKRPECMITFMRQTVLSSLATNETLQAAFANGGVPMQEYVASKLAHEGQMIRREHSNEGMPEPAYTYLDEKLTLHSELFDKVMYWFREIVKLSDMVKRLMPMASLLGLPVFKPYPARAQLFYVNKILLLALKARDVAEAAVRDVKDGKSVVISLSDTLECVLRDSIDPDTGECRRGDFSTILLRILDKTLRNPLIPSMTVFEFDLHELIGISELKVKINEIRIYSEQIRAGIMEDVFHLPLSPIDVIRQLITQETFVDSQGTRRNIRFEECTGRARQLEYLSPEGDDEFVNVTVKPRKKRHSNLIYNDFQNNKLDVILINACGAIGASAHAVATAEVDESEVRQRKMLIMQNDLDVNIDLQKRGRINRTGQVVQLPPLYEYIITAIPSEKRLNMMLRAKLRSLSANTTANQDQDKRQADFIDISNKYGNAVTADYIAANPELAFVLGVKKNTTASQMLARIAMLSVAAQHDIIDDLFSAYQNLEQELRRINQWDLEREHRDFEAKFVREELFTASVDETALGGASMLGTFMCRHRTFPYDAKSLLAEVEKGKIPYGAKPIESAELNDEIKTFFREANKKIRAKISERKQSLWDETIRVLVKYIDDEKMAQQLMLLAQRPLEFWHTEVSTSLSSLPKVDRIVNKLISYNRDFNDLEEREKKELHTRAQQKKRLLEVLSKAVIGQCFTNILSVLPVNEGYNRVMAVLKEIRFDKNPKRRFLPGKVQFVFALSAAHKELILNLVDKGSQNNYDRLVELSNSATKDLSSHEWDTEIARYNNRVLERYIITGNILGAFANPLIQKVKPHFISFTLAPDENGVVKTERGLLLPMFSKNLDELLSDVTLPLANGLKYANAVNHSYPISGLGIGFSIMPVRRDEQILFIISVGNKDSKKFETDSRFDSIRTYFKGTQVTSVRNKENESAKKKLTHYATKPLPSASSEFTEILTLLASLRAAILIPRQFLTVGEMKDFAQDRIVDENSNWPALDWRNADIIPPVRREVQARISVPVLPGSSINYVDSYSPTVLLARKTLAYEGRSLRENTMPGQIRALYFEWCNLSKDENIPYHKSGIIWSMTHGLHSILSNGSKQSVIHFGEEELRLLKDEIESETLSPVGTTIKRYYDEFLFLAPDKAAAKDFLYTCPCSDRLAYIRVSLERYIAGETDIIIDK